MIRVLLLAFLLVSSQVHATVVLMYHRVTDNFQPGPTVVGPERFKQHLQLFKSLGYTSITMGELVSKLRSGKPLKEKTVVLTFDDGWVEMTEVGEMLRAQKFNAIFYVLSGKFSSSGYLTTGQLVTLSKDFEIGAHSITHFTDHAHELTSIPESRMVGEAVISKNDIESVIGKKVTHYAWPYGHYTEKSVANSISAGFASTAVVERCSFPTNADKIPRVNVDGTWSDEKLKKVLSTGCGDE